MITAKDIDKSVGKRIKLRRTQLKLSQSKVAEPLGVHFQQLQKYENGTNRVSAGKLLLIAEILDVPISYFFEDFSFAATIAENGAPKIRNIETLLNLQQNWDGYGGSPISPKAVAAAANMVAIPCGDGSIHLEITASNRQAIIEISPDGNINTVSIEIKEG